MRPLLRQVARLHGLNREGWRRHANPWSGWTRVPILPTLVLVIWFWKSLGFMAWMLVGLLLVWTWVNPRIFPPARDLNSWMSRAVMGEYIWLRRAQTPVPNHYLRAIPVILAIELPAMVFLIAGLWFHMAWPVIYGLTLALIAKFWFLDRMVWLYMDMTETDPIYAQLDTDISASATD